MAKVEKATGIRTYAFLVAIESSVKITAEKLEDTLWDYMGGWKEVKRLDVELMGELDVYPEDEPKKG